MMRGGPGDSLDGQSPLQALVEQMLAKKQTQSLADLIAIAIAERYFELPADMYERIASSNVLYTSGGKHNGRGHREVVDSGRGE